MEYSDRKSMKKYGLKWHVRSDKLNSHIYSQLIEYTFLSSNGTLQTWNILQNKAYVKTRQVETKDITRKKKKEKTNHRQVSLMNIDTKIFKKMLANLIQQYKQYIKRIIRHGQVKLFQVWHLHINVIHINKGLEFWSSQ